MVVVRGRGGAVDGVVSVAGAGAMVVDGSTVDDVLRVVVDVASEDSLASMVLPGLRSSPATAAVVTTPTRSTSAATPEVAKRRWRRLRITRRATASIGGVSMVACGSSRSSNMAQVSSGSPSATRSAARPRLAWDFTVPAAQPNAAAVCSSLRSAR